MTLETFIATGWAMMRPVYRMDQRMFTPPSTTTIPPPLEEGLTPSSPVFDEEVTTRWMCACCMVVLAVLNVSSLTIREEKQDNPRTNSNSDMLVYLFTITPYICFLSLHLQRQVKGI